ncbi:BT4734/BF3469 family protein [Bacteroides sp.]|uniref:BT4734/BF3469 family protein n=1 Tax=Bacteroides sp. TaxID=29523 RepID=UPI003AB87760
MWNRKNPATYAIVARELSQIAGHPCDGACENLSRLCSEVYDPEIFYNPAAAFFPWRELWEKERPELVLRDEPKPEGASQGAGTGLLAGFLNQFLEKRPFVSGSRHESMLQLGHAARGKKLSPKELAELVQVTASKLAAADFTASEIESCIRSGYQYLSGKPALPKNAVYGQKVQGSPMNPNFRAANQDEQEELSEKSNELRASMPYFPQEVYEHLPELLKRGITLARGNRERDMLLMGMRLRASAR